MKKNEDSLSEMQRGIEGRARDKKRKKAIFIIFYGAIYWKGNCAFVCVFLEKRQHKNGVHLSKMNEREPIFNKYTH